MFQIYPCKFCKSFHFLFPGFYHIPSRLPVKFPDSFPTISPVFCFSFNTTFIVSWYFIIEILKSRLSFWIIANLVTCNLLRTTFSAPHHPITNVSTPCLLSAEFLSRAVFLINLHVVTRAPFCDLPLHSPLNYNATFALIIGDATPASPITKPDPFSTTKSHYRGCLASCSPLTTNGGEKKNSTANEPFTNWPANAKIINFSYKYNYIIISENWHVLLLFFYFHL